MPSTIAQRSLNVSLGQPGVRNSTIFVARRSSVILVGYVRVHHSSTKAIYCTIANISIFYTEASP